MHGLFGDFHRHGTGDAGLHLTVGIHPRTHGFRNDLLQRFDFLFLYAFPPHFPHFILNEWINIKIQLKVKTWQREDMCHSQIH